MMSTSEKDMWYNVSYPDNEGMALFLFQVHIIYIHISRLNLTCSIGLVQEAA